MLNLNRLYPHLLPDDIAVWQQFLAQHNHEYQYFDYDVPVGEGRDPGPEYSEAIRRMALILSHRRIDAVGHKPNQLDIIEVTTHAGIKAIGQLQVYPILYKETYHPQLRLVPLLVCSDISPDIMPTLNFMQITAHIYPKQE